MLGQQKLFFFNMAFEVSFYLSKSTGNTKFLNMSGVVFLPYYFKCLPICQASKYCLIKQHHRTIQQGMKMNVIKMSTDRYLYTYVSLF